MKAHLKIALLMLPTLSGAQVPVDEYGEPIASFEPVASVIPVNESPIAPYATDAAPVVPYQSGAEIVPVGDAGIPLLSYAELQELVGPIALYPDELLAVVLPASAYPLQIVAAARFLESLETDPTLQPDPAWDDSVVALINYPEVVDLLVSDLDWTWQLGDAVVAQQSDVVDAVEGFRDRAFAAGNLNSDAYQTVYNDEGVISISPVAEDVIYVPYYEPARVVHYQPRPVYYYYPRPCPVYYYPYAANHYFDRGYFWGVTTAFSIGWASDSLNVYHHSYRGHPYYGRSYWNDGWYRRPSINVYNTTYVSNTNVNINRHTRGDRWKARKKRREFVRDEGYSVATYQVDSLGSSKSRKRDPLSTRQQKTMVNTQATLTAPNNIKAAKKPKQEPIRFRPRDTRELKPAARKNNSRGQQPVALARKDRQRKDLLQDTTTIAKKSSRQVPAQPARNSRRQESEPVLRKNRQQTPVIQARSPARSVPSAKSNAQSDRARVSQPGRTRVVPDQVRASQRKAAPAAKSSRSEPTFKPSRTHNVQSSKPAPKANTSKAREARSSRPERKAKPSKPKSNKTHRRPRNRD